ncbi:MAG TPA: molybdopterin-binding protein [Rubrivivax sp.]|nr:molybdopterin-binding protein [Rubrivivax sp.]
MSESTRVTAAVLIIGNEILSGRTQDTNLAHLAKTLNGYGIQLREARVVPDVEAEIVAAVNALRARWDYLFTTGGIGPTHDDITADCVAKAFGVELEINEQIAELLRRRPSPPEVMASRMRMARVPRGAGLIDNPLGPPGFRIGNVYVMAGIPRIMQQMLASLDGKLARGVVVRSRSVTAFVSEGQIARGLGEVQDRFARVDIGSYPFQRQERFGTTLVMRGSDEAELDAALAEVVALIHSLGAQPQDIQQG